MASLVSGIQILEQMGAYRVLFPFLFIFAITYAVLIKTKVFGENKNIAGVLSLSVAAIFILYSQAVDFLNLLIPFVTLFLIFLLLVILVVTSIGMKTDAISNALSRGGGVIILIFLIIITLAALSLVMNTGEEVPPEEDAMGGIVEVILSPTVLMIIVLFVIFSIAAYVITLDK